MCCSIDGDRSSQSWSTARAGKEPVQQDRLAQSGRALNKLSIRLFPQSLEARSLLQFPCTYKAAADALDHELFSDRWLVSSGLPG